MQSSANRPTSTGQSAADNTATSPNRCPFLASPGDAGAAAGFRSDANQCLSAPFPVPVSTIHQDNYCLSSRYETCPAYRAATTRESGGALLPLTTIGVAGTAAAAPSWSERPTGPADAAVTISPGGSGPLLWKDNTHPDFQNGIEVRQSQRGRQTDRRPLLIGLLLLALIPLAWWIWMNARPDSSATGESASGAVVTLPTIQATAETGGAGEGGADNGDAPAGGVASPEAGAGVVGGAAASATPAQSPTPSDLERIAATATALFLNATPVTECVAPSWWVSYVVEEGDTIEDLAEVRGIMPEELIVANCLAGPELETGVTLLLPPVGVIAAGSATPTATATPRATATRRPVQPTRQLPLFPTATSGAIVFPTTEPPTADPPDEPPTQQPQRPTTAAPTRVLPLTSTPPPPPQGTSTPPGSTATPPPFGTPTPTATLPPTNTPPSP